MSKYLVPIILVITFFCGCSPNNVSIDNSYEKYFTQNNVRGTIAIYNNGQSNFTIYNLNRYKDSSYSPGSSFDIFSSLVGLQSGIIPNEKKIITQDSTDKSVINSGISLETAFANSSATYFQQLSKEIGEKDMKFWVDSIKYGNKNIGHSFDSCWFNNSLKITADEELGFIEKVYFNQLPFQKRVQNIVKKLLVKESNANYQLAFKSGTSLAANGHQIGWLVGWVEENKHPYFFVINTEGDKTYSMDTIKTTVLQPILKELGFFEGKK